jgi:hypothetical protein
MKDNVVKFFAMCIRGKSKCKKQGLEGVDLKSEYELIKQKKSKLSSALRKAVVREIEK